MTHDNPSPSRPITAPAAERNKGPILKVLMEALPSTGLVLEVASGTGQHVAHFAKALPALQWQPSDPDPQALSSISAWIQLAGVSNVHAPITLDVRQRPWPITGFDALVCINMLHIAPWKATLALFAGAADGLAAAGRVVVYGPFRRNGAHTASSNEAFDAQLRNQDPNWGIRDTETVAEAAEANGLALNQVVEMPANNLCLIFSAE